MPKSLSIDCEWIDQPAATDPLDKRTWADLRLFVEGRVMSRVWDLKTQAERKSIFVPVFPLVRWVVQNWWALLYESCKWEEVPATYNSHVTTERRNWLSRHCLRFADPGTLLPRLCLFSEGERVCLDFAADPHGAFPHMPAEFTESQRFWLPRESVVDSLKELVRTTLERLEEVSDPRVPQLVDNWHAIVEGGQAELDFCRAAGQLGRDPYMAEGWKTSLLEFLESDLSTESNDSLASDFLDSFEERSNFKSDWQNLQNARKNLQLGDSSPKLANEIDTVGSPAFAAYRLARKVREQLQVGAGPLTDVRQSMQVIADRPLMKSQMSPLSKSGIKAITGWNHDGAPIFASTQNFQPQNLRFLEARAVFLAGFECHRGPRLVTSAHTWSQKASRAFAAELLAPQAEILERWEQSSQSPAEVETLASYFDVSTKVIEHQLENSVAYPMEP